MRSRMVCIRDRIQDTVQATIPLLRKRRFDIIGRHIGSLKAPATILDVGGTVDYWRTVGFAPDRGTTIALLNLFAQDALPPGFTGVVGDARDLSAFGDKSCAFVMSNSVINLMPSWQDQVRMAREIRRVGRTYLVQCPNRRFPIDWRTWVPFFHYLPPTLQAWIFAHCPVGRYPRARDMNTARELAFRVRDLSVRELKQLFPGARILRERWLGLTKSIAACSFSEG